jgi:hypothetical protein
MMTHSDMVRQRHDGTGAQTALCHAAHSVEELICRWLLEVQDRSGTSKVPLTQSTLAQMLGVRQIERHFLSVGDQTANSVDDEAANG